MEIIYKENVLTAQQYLELERRMGQQETTRLQAERALEHSLCVISAEKDGQCIGMARLLGDQAIYWLIEDVRVAPEHQGRGVGSEMVSRLLDHIRYTALPGTDISVNLMCAKGKEGFYERFGFQQRPHEYEGAGMELEMHIEEMGIDSAE